MRRSHRVIALLLSILFTPLTYPAAVRSQSSETGNYILNLYDAFGPKIDGVTLCFGFSALIRWNGKLILFDAGTNAEILKRNTNALGVDLSEIDFAVASHSHFDHINGFDYLLEVNSDAKIYFPNDPFLGAPLPFDATGMDSHAGEELPPDFQYFHGKKQSLHLIKAAAFGRRMSSL